MKTNETRNTPYYTYTDTTWHFNKQDKERTGYSYRNYEREREEAERKRDERYCTRCY